MTLRAVNVHRPDHASRSRCVQRRAGNPVSRSDRELEPEVDPRIAEADGKLMRVRSVRIHDPGGRLGWVAKRGASWRKVEVDSLAIGRPLEVCAPAAQLGDLPIASAVRLHGEDVPARSRLVRHEGNRRPVGRPNRIAAERCRRSVAQQCPLIASMRVDDVQARGRVGCRSLPHGHEVHQEPTIGRPRGIGSELSRPLVRGVRGDIDGGNAALVVGNPGTVGGPCDLRGHPRSDDLDRCRRAARGVDDRDSLAIGGVPRLVQVRDRTSIRGPRGNGVEAPVLWIWSGLTGLGGLRFRAALENDQQADCEQTPARQAGRCGVPPRLAKVVKALQSEPPPAGIEVGGVSLLRYTAGLGGGSIARPGPSWEAGARVPATPALRQREPG
jgi:hypothetical protein